jgi:hypothetical protein
MNLEHESTSISEKTPDHLPGLFGALRTRYHVFIENYREPAYPGERARFGQKAINFAIFCALFIAILTVFGVGLSWFNAGSQTSDDTQVNPPDTKSASAEAPTPLPPAPAQPAGPAGHAELRPQSASEKKTDGK